MSAPPDLLEATENDGKGGRELRSRFKGGSRSDAGRPALPHHFQCGGGCGGAALSGGDGGGRGRAGKRGQEGRHQNALFYKDNVMVASSYPRWLQGTFSTLTGLFDRVGMQTNVGNQSEWFAAHAR